MRLYVNGDRARHLHLPLYVKEKEKLASDLNYVSSLDLSESEAFRSSESSDFVAESSTSDSDDINSSD